MTTPNKREKTDSINLKAISYQMEQLAQLEAKIKQNPVDEKFLENAKLTGLGIFRLIVMGEIKKGKSSLINALIGTKNLVPVHSDVATSTIFKIHYGAKARYTVYFSKDQNGNTRDKMEINAEQINEYGTEDGNPGNIKNIDFIRIESSSPILQNGLVIVDTPGVGGLFKKHREITFRHAPNADAVFFVTDSVESPIGADEVKFLKELRQITPLLTFIQTKSSKADGDARMARMNNNLEILKNEVGLAANDIAYFIVDSGLKIDADLSRDEDDLEDSGFVPLMNYLNNSLRKNQQVNIARSALRRSDAKLIPLKSELAARKEIINADTAEKRTQMNQEITDLQAHLTEWEQNSKPRILEEFRKGLTRLNREAQETLRPLQPGEVIQTDFEKQIEILQSPDEIKFLMTQVYSDLSALTSTVCLKISNKTKNEVTTLLESLMHNVIGTMEGRHDLILSLPVADQEKIRVNTSALERTINKNTDTEKFESIRTSLYGGMAGMAMASMAGAVIGSVIPVVGTIVGGWIGSIIAGGWGGYKASEIAANQKLDAYKRECYGALQQSMGSAYQSALSQVNILISDMQTEATSVLQKMMKQASDNLVKSRNDLSQRQKANQTDILQQQKMITAFEAELNVIETALQTYRAAVIA